MMNTNTVYRKVLPEVALKRLIRRQSETVIPQPASVSQLTATVTLTATQLIAYSISAETVPLIAPVAGKVVVPKYVVMKWNIAEETYFDEGNTITVQPFGISLSAPTQADGNEATITPVATPVTLANNTAVGLTVAGFTIPSDSTVTITMPYDLV